MQYYLVSSFRRYLVVVAAWLFATSISSAVATATDISVVASPTDQIACPGSGAVFECRINATENLPNWLINGVPYDPLASVLPERVRYILNRMIVEPIMPMDNGTSFSCYLNFLTESSPFLLTHVQSETGILYVPASDFATHTTNHHPEERSFTLPKELTDYLLANKGSFVDIDFRQGCRHFDKGIFLSPETGMEALKQLQQQQLAQVSLLAVIDNNPEQPTPLASRITVSNNQVLAIVGLPYALSYDGSGSISGSYPTPDKDQADKYRKAIVSSLAPDAGIIMYGGDLYIENIAFHRPDKAQAQFLQQLSGLLTIQNVSFSASVDHQAKTIIHQAGGRAIIEHSTFKVPGKVIPVHAKSAITLRQNRFKCLTRECRQSVLLTPKACYSIPNTELTVADNYFSGFHHALGIQPEKRDGRFFFRIPANISGNKFDRAPTGTAISLDGWLKLNLSLNRVSQHHLAVLFSPRNRISVAQSTDNVILDNTSPCHGSPLSGSVGFLDRQGVNQQVSCENNHSISPSPPVPTETAALWPSLTLTSSASLLHTICPALIGISGIVMPLIKLHY